MFKLHALLVDILSKIRQAINKIIIRQKHSKKHPIKNISFNNESLEDQLYRFQSITPKGLELNKIYFLAHPAPDLLKDGMN